MTIRSLASMLLLSACLHARAELHTAERFVITGDQVAARIIATFAQRGIALNRSQISLPTSVSANEESPSLEVLHVEKLGALHSGAAEAASAVKLGCSSPKVCLPFYAVVTLPNISNTSATTSPATTLSLTQPRGETVIKSGAHVAMVVVHGSTRLQMGVVSLENGALHKQIKVRTADRKQIFTAEVIDANTVTGTY